MTEVGTLRDLAKHFNLCYNRVRRECLSLDPEFIDGRKRYYAKDKVQERVYEATTRPLTAITTKWAIGTDEANKIASSFGVFFDKNGRMGLNEFEEIEKFLVEAGFDRRKELQAPDERLYSANEIAEQLDMDRSYILALLKKHGLKIVQKSGHRGHVMIPESSFKALLEIRSKELRFLSYLVALYETSMKELREICKAAEIAISSDGKVAFNDYRVIMAILDHDEVLRRKKTA